MADTTVSSSSYAANQAYDIAQQNAADATSKSGKHVVGQAANNAAGATLGATTATAAAEPTDGIQGVASAANQSKAVANTDAPTLPNPTGSVASPTTAMRVVRGSDVFASGGDGVFAALEAASNERQNDVNSAMLVKRGQAALQLTAKQQEFQDKKSEIHGMQTSAITKFASSFVGLGASLFVTGMGERAAGVSGRVRAKDSNTPHAAGSKPNTDINKPDADLQPPAGQVQTHKDHLNQETKPQGDAANPNPGANPAATGTDLAGTPPPAEAAKSDKSEAKGAKWRNAGMNIGGFVDAIHGMMDVNAGGMAEQNKAQLAQKQDAIQAQVAQTNVDSAGAWLDNAKDQRKAAQQAIQTHVQMWGDSISNVWK